MKCVREKVAHIVDENYLVLNFQCGIRICEEDQKLSDTIRQAFVALEAVQSGRENILCYENLSEFEKKLQYQKTEKTETVKKENEQIAKPVEQEKMKSANKPVEK